MARRYWAYDNRVHHYTKVHSADCSYCNDGHGFQPRREDVAGEWLGPFSDVESALRRAGQTGRQVSVCKVCSPK